jgi:hypothetical protein
VAKEPQGVATLDQARALVNFDEVEEKISLGKAPSQGCRARMVAGPNIAEKSVIGVRKLDIHVRSAQTFAFVHDSARLLRADVFIETAPKKQDRRMQVRNPREQRRRDIPAVK